MVDAHFTFQTTAFDDAADIKAQNVNGIVGHSLAGWLAATLKNAGLDASDTWAEDHGWDFAITHDGTKYLCACSVITNESPFEGHVALAKSRSLKDKIFGRNKYESSDPVVAQIRRTLESHAEIVGLNSEL